MHSLTSWATMTCGEGYTATAPNPSRHTGLNAWLDAHSKLWVLESCAATLQGANNTSGPVECTFLVLLVPDRVWKQTPVRHFKVPWEELRSLASSGQQAMLCRELTWKLISSTACKQMLAYHDCDAAHRTGAQRFSRSLRCIQRHGVASVSQHVFSLRMGCIPST